MKGKTNKIHGIFKLSIILSIIFCSVIFSAAAASAADKKYYWDRTNGVSITGFTTNWTSCSSNNPQNGFRVTSIGSAASSCTNGALTRSNVGDMFLEIFPTAYTSNTTVKGINATFYLGRPSSGTTTYRIYLGYAKAGVFTSFGNVTQSLTSSSNRLVTINTNTISGTAPAGSNLALKLSVTTLNNGQTAKVNLGTDGGSTGSNSGRFYVNETVASAPTYNVSISASPTSAGRTAGNSYLYNITVNNTGNAKGNYTLSVADSDTVNFTTSTLGTTTLQINSGGSVMTTLNVTARTSATTGALDNTTVTVTSVENSAYTNSTRVQTTVVSVPRYNVSISASPTSAGITAGNSYLYNITVNNTGNADGNYTLSVADSDTVNFTTSTLGTTTLQINNGGSAMTTLNVTARTSATTGALDNTTVTVISVENPAYANSTRVQTTDSAGSAGGPDCKACHDAGGPAPKLVNFSIANNSAHKNLNSGASSTVNAENKKCWACHGDGTQPGGHPPAYLTPVPCENCHTGTGGYNAPPVKEHIQNGSDVQTTAACNLCHGNNGMFIDGGGIGTITHYIKNVTDTTTTPYGHFGTIDTTNCLICHNGQYTGNASWSSPVNITTSLKRKHTETTNAQCDGCHKDNTVSTLANVDFHNASLSNFGGNCLDCHANAE